MGLPIRQEALQNNRAYVVLPTLNLRGLRYGESEFAIHFSTRGTLYV